MIVSAKLTFEGLQLNLEVTMKPLINTANDRYALSVAHHAVARCGFDFDSPDIRYSWQPLQSSKRGMLLVEVSIDLTFSKIKRQNGNILTTRISC